MLATRLFYIRQGTSKSLKEYLVRYNDLMIKVMHPNEEVFVGAFHNGLRVGQFNESTTHKPVSSLAEVVTRAEYYIKDEESNSKKKVRDVKLHTSNADNSQKLWRN